MRARINYCFWGPWCGCGPWMELRGDGVVWQVSLSLVDGDEEDKVLVGATQCDRPGHAVIR